MSVEINKRLLKRQLETQAELFVTEQDEKKLVSSILTTCLALLGTAENSISDSFTEGEFNTIYAGYLGIANKVNRFYTSNKNVISEIQSGKLQELSEDLQSLAEIEKSHIDSLSDLKTQIEITTKSIEIAKSNLENKQKLYESLIEKKNNLDKKLSDIQSQISDLENEISSDNKRIESFGHNIEMLIQETSVAKDIYAEMTAYYEELGRIQSAMQEEGIVDIESLSQKLLDMNKQGNDLISQYDRILKNIAEDVESLKDKIEQRRKPG